MSVPLMLAWVFFLAVLGVTMAIPMKRQMINIEQLRFPPGIAAVETLRALHAKSSRGLRAAKALGLAGLMSSNTSVDDGCAQIAVIPDGANGSNRPKGDTRTLARAACLELNRSQERASGASSIWREGMGDGPGRARSREPSPALEDRPKSPGRAPRTRR